MNSDQEISDKLKGAWKLVEFLSLNGEESLPYHDILLFSGRYYSDFQAPHGGGDTVNCHVGMYKISSGSITFQIQLSNRSGDIGKVTTGEILLTDQQLTISIPFGPMPGRWVFARLE